METVTKDIRLDTFQVELRNLLQHPLWAFNPSFDLVIIFYDTVTRKNDQKISKNRSQERQIVSFSDVLCPKSQKNQKRARGSVGSLAVSRSSPDSRFCGFQSSNVSFQSKKSRKWSISSEPIFDMFFG